MGGRLDEFLRAFPHDSLEVDCRVVHKHHHAPTDVAPVAGTDHPGAADPPAPPVGDGLLAGYHCCPGLGDNVADGDIVLAIGVEVGATLHRHLWRRS